MLRGFLRRVTVSRDQKYKPFPSLKEKLESFSLSRIQKKNPSFSVRWILHDQGMILIQFLILFQFLMDLFMCSDSAANTLSICRKRRTSVYPHGMQNLLGPRSPLHSALYHPFAFSFFLSFSLSLALFLHVPRWPVLEFGRRICRRNHWATKKCRCFLLRKWTRRRRNLFLPFWGPTKQTWKLVGIWRWRICSWGARFLVHVQNSETMNCSLADRCSSFLGYQMERLRKERTSFKTERASLFFSLQRISPKFEFEKLTLELFLRYCQRVSFLTLSLHTNFFFFP